MPKEYVHGEVLAGPEPSDSIQSPVIDIGWSREAGHVQIASRVRECEVFFDEDHPNAPIPVEYGYYVNLNRTGINDLIRHLRRARDQAFGRDE